MPAQRMNLGPRWRSAAPAAWAIASLAIIAQACGSERAPLRGGDAPTSFGARVSASEGGNASTEGGTSASEGGAEAPSSGGDSGAEGGADGADGVASACGDGEVQDDEDCDPAAAETYSCLDFGFDTGSPSCSATCQLDVSGCTGVEQCTDGRDNDGDGDLDCGDSDCSDACNAGCAAPLTLADPAEAFGSTLASPDLLSVSCAADSQGGEQVFRVVAAQTGRFTASATSSSDLSVSIRRSCTEAASEVACGNLSASLDVSKDDELFVIIKADSALGDDAYVLRVESRLPGACGDEIWDIEEECEDGATDNGDGCDADCHVVPSETEPNGSLAEASGLPALGYGRIEGADEDFFELLVPNTPSTFVASVYSLGAKGCSDRTVDPYLELVDADGTFIVADDDGGDGTCPELKAFGLAAGNYYVRVATSPDPDSTRPDFGYKLTAKLDTCGNGSKVYPEECDDMNTADGDGCDSTCRSE